MKTLPVIAIVCVVMTLTGADAKGHLIKRSIHCCGWSEYNGRCFIFIPSSMTWTSAEKNCQSLGGNLASVRDVFEYQAIQKLTSNGTSHYPDTWIGGSDGEEDGVWLWSDGTPFHYSNWYPGEPNNLSGPQNCLIMNFGASKGWDDEKCTVRRSSVCVKKIQ
ncbi:ladderlectin-like [Mugil cephalus]|uniref:ladderlectin-like n=1 Tax=Mugil cephalus TaxID=48193 RepID=UPI001FB83D1B|nr:ladderlectin-like [Mugil cephalus]